MSAEMANPENAMADQVIDLIPKGLALRILHKFANTVPTAGSQLARAGVGRSSSAVLGAAATVSQKLERCPIVARVLWLETAADCTRNVIRPQEARGRPVEVVGERPEVWAVLMEYGVGVALPLGGDLPEDAMQRDARRLKRTWTYRRKQWPLMVLELSACWAEDPAFRGWIENRA